MNSPQRVAALGLVVGLHVAVIGGFVVAQLRTPPPPEERTLSVSFVSESPAAPAPTPPQPPQPTPPPPEPRLMATPRPTASTMSAPPMEREPQREAPQQPVPQAPQPPASAPSSASPDATAMTPPSSRADYLNNPQPVYPYGSKLKRQQGTTRLRVEVSPEGAALQVVLDRSSGFSDLDKSALTTVKTWKFVPAKQGGRAVSAWVIVPIEFSLKNS